MDDVLLLSVSLLITTIRLLNLKARRYFSNIISLTWLFGSLAAFFAHNLRSGLEEAKGCLRLLYRENPYYQANHRARLIAQPYLSPAACDEHEPWFEDAENSRLATAMSRLGFILGNLLGALSAVVWTSIWSASHMIFSMTRLAWFEEFAPGYDDKLRPGHVMV
jgi:hypothetical protein